MHIKTYVFQFSLVAMALGDGAGNHLHRNHQAYAPAKSHGPSSNYAPALGDGAGLPTQPYALPPQPYGPAPIYAYSNSKKRVKRAAPIIIMPLLLFMALQELWPLLNPEVPYTPEVAPVYSQSIAKKRVN